MGRNRTHDKFNIKYITRAQRWYRNYTAALGSFLIAFFAASSFAPVYNSDAAQLFSATYDGTGYFVNVTGSESIALDVTATPDGQLIGAVDTITTTTNSPRGYQLYISASPNYLYLNGDGSTAASGKFSPIGGDLTSATTLGINTWGFAFDKTAAGVPNNNFADVSAYETENSKYPASTAVYASIPTTDTLIQKIEQPNLDTDGTELNIYYGLKAGTSLAAGTYSGQISYTAISDGVNNNTDFMQDFTTAECNALTESKADAVNEIELMDKRDLKWYRVAKLADGNCWMVQNLALDGGITLTPDDSDVTENRTLADSVEAKAPVENDVVQIYAGEAEIQDANGSYYGNIYNWNAATAGTGKEAVSANSVAYESICPKGWRLPDSSGDKSYSNLAEKYGIAAADTTGQSISAITNAPLYFPAAGYYYDGQGQDDFNYGARGGYWSRAKGSHIYIAYALFWDNDNFNIAHGHHIAARSSVRCVFEGDVIQPGMHIQDVNLTMCENLAETTAAADNRVLVRDYRGSLNGYFVAKLADGKCWTVNNMLLDGGVTLQPTDSNVTENRTLPGNIVEGIASDYDVAQIYSKDKNIVDGGYGSAYGNLYNWKAATATVGEKGTNGTVKESICPLGWRMPDATGNGSWSNLLGKYGLPTEETTNMDAIAAVRQFPLLLGVAGYYAETSLQHRDTAGIYWARQGNADSTAYNFFIFAGDGRFWPKNTIIKSDLISVRCVLGE